MRRNISNNIISSLMFQEMQISRFWISFIFFLILFSSVLTYGCKTQEPIAEEGVETSETLYFDSDSAETREISEEEITDEMDHKPSAPRVSEATILTSADMAMSHAKARVESGRGEMSRPIPADQNTGGIKPEAGLITAAEWNDLNNWNDWKELMQNQDYNEMQEHWNMFPRSRYSIFVKNKYELPLQDILVELLNKDGNVLWASRTDNAGKAELWSDMQSRDKSFEPVDARITAGGKSFLIEDIRTIEEGVNNLVIDIECLTVPNVDVYFAIDATGSMSDEIAYIQAELKDVISRSIVTNDRLNLRLGAVFYRDSSDAYLTQVSALSNKPEETLNFIAAQSATGGGDYPEAVDAALEIALAQDWSEDAVARILFLLLDAPPHHHPKVLQRIRQQIMDAAKEGIKIIPITASGINRQTEFLMKFMAISTNGTYVFITDHSGIGNPHLDPVVKDYEVEKLNDLLVRILYNYTKSNGCNPNDNTVAGFSVYPNPARDYVNVRAEMPIKKLNVLSNSGKLLQSKEDLSEGENQINLEGLLDGVYTIQCFVEGNEYTRSVVVVNN